jgi:peptide/nickel transport system substrate-binding protein
MERFEKGADSERRAPVEDAESGFTLSRAEFLKLGGAAGVGLALPGLLTSTAQAAASPKRGGTLRIAAIGGGSSETLNPNQLIGDMDIARSRCLFEGLTDFDPNGKVYNVLAQELSPNKHATVWKVRLQDGVEFHNGKTLTADDVVRAFRYMLNPANKTQGQATLQPGLTPGGIRKIDKTTVEFRLTQPNSFLPAVLGDARIKIFYGSNFALPIGTGPFKFKSWTRGERSHFVRFPNYHQSGLPYLNAVDYISILDNTARLNALLAGQVDAIAQLDPALLPQARNNSSLRVLYKSGATYTNMYMQTNVAPFTDVRVRQALRLAIDRKQIIRNGLSGLGHLGNDLPCWFDADYDAALPQHHYDPEQAKSLLAAAKQSKLTLTLQTSDAAPGMLSSSTLFQAQAAAAGITINLRQWPTDTYYTAAYRMFPFGMSNWGGRPLAAQVNEAYLTTSQYNETNYNNPRVDSLYKQAQATSDPKKQKELMFALQNILWHQGGTILWGFLPNLDASSKRVHGITPSVIRNLGNYTVTNAWLG